MKYKFTVTGLDCPNCAAKLAAMIESADGISSAKINYIAEKLTIESELDESTVLSASMLAAKKFSKSVKIEK